VQQLCNIFHKSFTVTVNLAATLWHSETPKNSSFPATRFTKHCSRKHAKSFSDLKNKLTTNHVLTCSIHALCFCQSLFPYLHSITPICTVKHLTDLFHKITTRTLFFKSLQGLKIAAHAVQL